MRITDKMRLDWLEGFHSWPTQKTQEQGKSFIGKSAIPGVDGPRYTTAACRGELFMTFRDAIDAAIRAEKSSGKSKGVDR